jgi:hypothetical protein
MSIRASYETYGVLPYYKSYGSTYGNPHEQVIHEVLDIFIDKHKPNLDNILDLACGSGEISSHFKDNNVIGIDPYTQEAYFNRIGKKPLPYSFEQISQGVISEHQYSIIICSFALHLVESSYLPLICYQLAQISPRLLILTPHKKPIIKWHWNLKDEFVHKRVRARYYESLDF